MKKLFTLFILLSFFIANAQLEIPKEIVFDTPFVTAENNLILLPMKDSDKDFSVGIPYFDESAGYSFKFWGTLIPQNKSFIFKPSESSIITRWQNLDLLVALIPANKIAEWNIPSPADFLKIYKSSRLEDDVLVDKMSFLNGSNYSGLALKGLEKLKAKNYKSEKFYFELSYSYNALSDFPKAEAAISEAALNGYSSELLVKEKHYAILKQKRIPEAATYLENNFKNFKTKTYKSESIVNQISNFYNISDFENAKKWISLYKKEIGSDQYQTNVDRIESALKKKK